MENPEIQDILNSVDPATRLPYGVSRYYASLAENRDPAVDPIAAQYIPRQEEGIHLDYESPDPISDGQYSISPRVIHHYHDRILMLVNDRCATYCRHCFRRHFTGNSNGRIQQDEIDRAAEYLKKTPEVQEVLLSGGDPLMLPDEDIARIMESLRGADPERPLLFRLATRMPVVLPSRITEALVDRLLEASGRRLWVVTHANHPRELSSQFEQAAARFIDRGVPILNQAVLLRGVNDEVETLETLFRRLIQLRVKPYYLFQGDLASGTAHFRTNLEKGFELMDALRERLSGMAMPTFAVDLPGGGGKIPLSRDRIKEIRNGMYVLTDSKGREFFYPVEHLPPDGEDA